MAKRRLLASSLGASWTSFALALLLSASAGASELEVGSAHAVDPVPAYVPGYGRPAGVASDGEDWLGLSIYSSSKERPARLEAARVSAEGIVLDHPGFLVTEAPRIEEASLSFDGTDYVAVWAESTSSQGPWTVRLQRIAADGSLFGPSVTLGSVTMPVSSPLTLVVASGAHSDLVLWCARPEVGPGETCSWVQVEDSSVVASDSMGFAQEVGGAQQLAASGDSWLWVSGSHDGVCLIRVGSDGLALDDAPVQFGNGYFPSVTSAELGWVVTWQDELDLKAASVSFDGAVAISPTPVSNGEPILEDVSVERTPEGFVVTGRRWGDGIVAQLLDSDLVPSSDVITLAGGYFYDLGSTSATWGGSSLLVNWADVTPNAPNCSFAKRLTASGDVLDQDALCITTKPSDQRSPAAAYGAGAWLVAWEDNRSAVVSADIYAQRLDEQGVPLSQSPILIANDDSEELSPAVAGSSHGWLVAWNHATRVEVARVSPSGEVLDPSPITFGSNVFAPPTVAFDGTNWVVGWVDVDSSGPFSYDGSSFIIRIDPQSGAPIDAQPILVGPYGGALSKESSHSPLSVDVDSSGYALAWQSSIHGLVVEEYDFDLSWQKWTDLLDGYETYRSYDLEYQGGNGWVFLSNDSDAVTFFSLGSDLPEQNFQYGKGYDLASLGQQALAAWYPDGTLELGLAETGGALESKAEIPGRTTSPHVAVRSETQALLSIATDEVYPRYNNRVVARVIELSNGEGGSGGVGEAGASNGSTGGEAGEDFGGAAGADSTGGTGSGGATTGGVTGQDGGTPGSGGEDSNPGAGGENSGGESPGTPSGGVAGDDDGGSSASGGFGGTNSPSNEGRDRTVACSCRAVRATSGNTTPWFALLAGLALYRRRRDRD